MHEIVILLCLFIFRFHQKMKYHSIFPFIGDFEARRYGAFQNKGSSLQHKVPALASMEKQTDSTVCPHMALFLIVIQGLGADTCCGHRAGPQFHIQNEKHISPPESKV